MANKRHHVEDESFPDDREDGNNGLRRESIVSSNANEITSPKPTAQNYPRKRVAIACDFCRIRKTRCDAAKPSCSFCAESGVECRYRGGAGAGVSEKPKEVPSAEAFAQLEKRLANVEAKLRFGAGVENGNFTSILSPVSPRNDINHQQQHINQAYSPGYSNGAQPPLPPIYTPAPFVSSSFRQTQSEALTARPSFLTFCCPSFVVGESWDDTEQFYDDELAAGDLMQFQFIRSLLQSPDLSKKTTRLLQQNFVQNFLSWVPIFNLSACIKHVEDAFASNFALENTSTCISFLVFAIGAISESNSILALSSPPSAANRLPGIEYLSRGSRILDSLSLKTGDVAVLQCRILQAAYYQFAIRPLQAWNAICQASRDVMHMLSSSKRRQMDAADKDVLHRAFWACSIIHHGLEAVMKMHPIGLRQFHDIVPLPLAEEEEIGFYYFLAQASLRQILTEALDVVGYHTGTVVHAPIVTHEIHSQLREWHQHLPPAVRFPLDTTPLFDPRTSFLRTQYVALFIVVRWESVLRVLAAPSYPPPLTSKSNSNPTSISAPPSGANLSRLRSEAAECITSCVLCLSTAEETLSHHNLTLATQFILWSSFASLTALILTYRVPAMAYVTETAEHGHILAGYGMLRAWEHLPLVSRGLGRARGLMERVGLGLEGDQD